MLTVEPGIADALPEARRRLPAAGLGLAVAGAAAGALAGDSCSPGLALPVSGLALTVAGALLWLTGMSKERRDRLAIAVAAGLALLSMAALQQLLACMLGRDAMAVAELLQAGGVMVLVIAAALMIDRLRRARVAATAEVERRRRLRELHERAARERALAAARRRAERVGAAQPEAARAD